MQEQFFFSLLKNSVMMMTRRNVGWTWNIARVIQSISVYRISVRKPEVCKLDVRIYEDNIEMDLKGAGYENVD
jgi:hypothetical protein